MYKRQRFHGRREKETASFMEACKEAKPDVLIIEGTRVDSNNSKKELEVEDEICDISSEAKGISVGNWSVRDTDRMLSFLNAAKKLGKKLAISLKRARMSWLNAATLLLQKLMMKTWRFMRTGKARAS